MRTILVIALMGAGLAACSTNTKGSWSCAGVGEGRTCASIDAIDNGTARSTSGRNAESPGIEGAEPVRWWEPRPFVFTDGEGARREGDQVLSIVFAPWVDAQGDYHHRSVVQSVVRRGGWWLPTTSTVQASRTLAAVGASEQE